MIVIVDYRTMLGVQVFIGHHIWSCSIVWLFYGPNFAGFFLMIFVQKPGQYKCLSPSFILQFHPSWQPEYCHILSCSLAWYFMARILTMSCPEYFSGGAFSPTWWWKLIFNQHILPLFCLIQFVFCCALTRSSERTCQTELKMAVVIKFEGL